MTINPESIALAPGGRPFHPLHGTHDPVTATPLRVPGSIRRTSSIAQLRPNGINGDLILKGFARDLLTRADGTTRVVAEAAMEVRINFLDERKIVEIATMPEHPNIGRLVGVPASTGYRAVLEAAIPEHKGAQSLLYLLLDDVPTATLVSGFAMGYAQGGYKRVPSTHKEAPRLQHPDLCAGWKVGGTILEEIEKTGSSPVVTGPHAPSFVPPDDPLGWHELEPLPMHGMRRHRRLDLVAGDPLRIDIHFRDSHMTETGEEQIIHEYTVEGAIDRASLTVTAMEAAPKALPWKECPLAVASAGRLVGMPVQGLRARVRNEFVGPTTCTHLNDTLRTVEDVESLARLLAAHGPEAHVTSK